MWAKLCGIGFLLFIGIVAGGCSTPSQQSSPEEIKFSITTGRIIKELPNHSVGTTDSKNENEKWRFHSTDDIDLQILGEPFKVEKGWDVRVNITASNPQRPDTQVKGYMLLHFSEIITGGSWYLDHIDDGSILLEYPKKPLKAQEEKLTPTIYTLTGIVDQENVEDKPYTTEYVIQVPQGNKTCHYHVVITDGTTLEHELNAASIAGYVVRAKGYIGYRNFEQYILLTEITRGE